VSNLSKQQNRVLLGHISGAHGIRGEVVVKAYTSDPADIDAYGPLTDVTGTKQYKLKVVRVMPKGVVVRIVGVSDRNAAEALKGTALHVPRSALGKTEPGEYFYNDLLGLEAIDPTGLRIGVVKAVENFGAGDLLEISFDGISKTEFVPFVEAYVPDVDIAAGRVTVIMPPDDGSKPEDEPKDEA
jgi:16S rRNA processing protein RimM